MFLSSSECSSPLRSLRSSRSLRSPSLSVVIRLWRKNVRYPVKRTVPNEWVEFDEALIKGGGVQAGDPAGKTASPISELLRLSNIVEPVGQLSSAV